MIKIDRIKLVDNIRRKLNLPKNRKSKGYFSRKELLEILAFFDTIKNIIGDENNEKKNS